MEGNIMDWHWRFGFQEHKVKMRESQNTHRPLSLVKSGNAVRCSLKRNKPKLEPAWEEQIVASRHEVTSEYEPTGWKGVDQPTIEELFLPHAEAAGNVVSGARRV